MVYHEVIKGKVSRGTGAKKRKNRDKKKAHIGRYPINTQIGKRTIRIVRGRGGNKKIKVRKDNMINVATPNGVKRGEIVRVIEGNIPEYTRQNIITKGAIVEVKGIGKARITSRPGQHGVINGVLIQ